MTTVRRANARTERESSEMTSVFLLFSLLTPDALGLGPDSPPDARDLIMDDASSEPQCAVIDQMLAKYDAEYEVELALEIVDNLF